MEAARKAEEEKIAREEAEAEEARQTAEERKRLIRQAELDAIKRRTGSTVSPIITGTKEKACADLLASYINDIDVHFVKSESIWGGKFTVWYRDRHRGYAADQYSTRKCQIGGGSVKILNIFEAWE